MQPHVMLTYSDLLYCDFTTIKMKLNDVHSYVTQTVILVKPRHILQRKCPVVFPPMPETPRPQLRDSRRFLKATYGLPAD